MIAMHTLLPPLDGLRAGVSCDLCGQIGHVAAACQWTEGLCAQHRYQAEKHAWAAANPAATPEQYERAAQDIARRLGI